MPRTVFDVPALKARQQDLEQLAAQPDFWDDQQAAQKQMRRLDEVKAQLQQLADWGFNVIRLGTMWSGVEPAENQVNITPFLLKL